MAEDLDVRDADGHTDVHAGSSRCRRCCKLAAAALLHFVPPTAIQASGGAGDDPPASGLVDGEMVTILDWSSRSNRPRHVQLMCMHYRYR